MGSSSDFFITPKSDVHSGLLELQEQESSQLSSASKGKVLLVKCYIYYLGTLGNFGRRAESSISNRSPNMYDTLPDQMNVGML